MLLFQPLSNMLKFLILILLPSYSITLQDVSILLYNRNIHEPSMMSNTIGYLSAYPQECADMLEEFAQFASNFTLCSILNARPIKICESCVGHYVRFRDKYKELLTKIVNGTTCGSLFMSHDRLDAIAEFHDNILSVWDKGNCNACFDWSTVVPVLKNTTVKFNKKFYDTIDCITNNMNLVDNNICEKCMQFYLELDEFYKTLSADTIGVDIVCMDIVDMMNATRSIWSKNLNCCQLRRTPEVVFLCCAAIISVLPLLFYVAVRFCGPIRDLPNVLKQSRFQQSILRAINARND